MPGVEVQEFIESHWAGDGVDEFAGEGFDGSEFEEDGEAEVDVFDDGERGFDGECGIGEKRPGVLVIRLDGGLVFGEGEAEADEGIHVRIGDVVDELTDGPAAVAIGGIEICLPEGVKCGFEKLGQIADLGDGGLALGNIRKRGEGKGSYRVAGV